MDLAIHWTKIVMSERYVAYITSVSIEILIALRLYEDMST